MTTGYRLGHRHLRLHLEAPGVDEVAHHLADPSLGDPKPDGQVLTGDHRVVSDKVERPLLRRAGAEGRRSLRHPLGVGYGRPLPLRRLSARPSAWAGAGDHALQRKEPASDDPRRATPEAKVPSFHRVPGLHGNVAVTEVPFSQNLVVSLSSQMLGTRIRMVSGRRV